MGNVFICSCLGINDKTPENIDINVKSCDMIINQKNINNNKIHENQTIANNNINGINNNEVNNNNNNMSNYNSIYSHSDNMKKDKDYNRKSLTLMQSFNEEKSISPSNNPLDGLVKLIPKNEQ